MKRNEHGIALVITLFLMATLSALAVSMMFLAQTETAASRNYRTMSQARYAAEAGVHELANYLMSTSYVPTAKFDATKFPVTCTASPCVPAPGGGSCTATSIATAVSSGCIVVGYSAATSNNPDGRVHTPTTNTLAVNASGSLTNAAAGTVTFAAAAILMSMRTVNVYGGAPAVVQTWQIISDGTVPPSTAAIVEVSTTMEQEVGFASTYAVFATDPECAAITLKGNMNTNSYSSAALGTAAAWSGGSVGAGHPLAPGSNGGIGTNGNLNVTGNVSIGGTLSTPRTGAGTCSNSSVDAISGKGGSWSYTGMNKLSQSVTYPPPTIPLGIPSGTSVSLSSGDSTNTCKAKVALLSPGWTCAVSSTNNQVTIYPGTSAAAALPLTLPDVSVASNTNLVIAGLSGAPAGTVTSVTLNVNSFSIGSNATLSLADGSGSLTKANVLMNIAGQNLTSPLLPLDLSGGGSVNTQVPTGVTGVSANSGFDPSRFQIMYAGTAQINMVGTNSVSAMVYAPKASVVTSGNGTLYGSMLGYKFEDDGGATISYDASMYSKFSTLGNFMLTSFSWKKY